MIMDLRLRASPEQFVTILEFMERYGDLAKPEPGARGRMRTDFLWPKLAKSLNSVAGGVTKSTDKWKKVWADWKSKTKKKYLNIRRNSTGSEAPNSRNTLTKLEVRVIKMIGIEMAMEKRHSAAPPTSQNSQIDPLSDLKTDDGDDDESLTAPWSPSLQLHEIVLPFSNELELAECPESPEQHSPAPGSPESGQGRHSPTPESSESVPAASPQPTHRSVMSPPHSELNKEDDRRETASTHRHSTVRRKRQPAPYFSPNLFLAVEKRRLFVEEKRQTNESRKLQAEAMREKNESRRLYVETMREKNESRRLEVEAMREKNESRRLEVEAMREKNESRRLEVEAMREKNESRRLEVEAMREKNEAQKIGMEASLDKIEAQRIEMDVKRERMESRRQELEAIRERNEARRLEASQDTNEVMDRLVNVAERFLQRLMQID